MITYENIQAENYYTTGFDLEIEEEMDLVIGSGTFNVVTEKDTTTIGFPRFAFEVEEDDELPVIYDIYLLSDENEDGVNIHIDRTEIGSGIAAFYEGEASLLHCLLSFTIPPNTKTLAEIEFKVRDVQQVEGETNG